MAREARGSPRAGRASLPDRKPRAPGRPGRRHRPAVTAWRAACGEGWAQHPTRVRVQQVPDQFCCSFMWIWVTPGSSRVQDETNLSVLHSVQS